MIIEAGLGGARVLARSGSRRIWLLDDSAALLWDLHKAGQGAAEIAALVAQRVSVEAGGHVRQTFADWHATGLTGEPADGAEGQDAAFQPLATFPPPRPLPAGTPGWRMTVAGRPVLLSAADAAFAAQFRLLFGPQAGGGGEAALIDHLVLAGDRHGWRLVVNGAETACGAEEGNAVLAVLAALTELGYRTSERLLVVHGAALVGAQGLCLLLAAPGGSGKTTLTMALEAGGFRLLSDDVVPIAADGRALGLGLPACIKRGSWEVLSSCRPDLAAMPALPRLGEQVRHLPPRHPPFTGAAAPALLVFPHYRPGMEPALNRLPPEAALRRLVEAEAVIRDLTQEKLEQLCRWVAAIPAFEIHYPDLAEAQGLLERVMHPFHRDRGETATGGRLPSSMRP